MNKYIPTKINYDPDIYTRKTDKYTIGVCALKNKTEVPKMKNKDKIIREVMEIEATIKHIYDLLAMEDDDEKSN